MKTAESVYKIGNYLEFVHIMKVFLRLSAYKEEKIT